jgi:hypothetical protein
MGFYHHHQRQSFHIHRIHQKVTLEWHWSVVGFMRPYNGIQVWICISFLLFSCMSMAVQGVCSWRGGWCNGSGRMMAAGWGPGDRPVYSHFMGVKLHCSDIPTYYSTPYSHVVSSATISILFDISSRTEPH